MGLRPQQTILATLRAFVHAIRMKTPPPIIGRGSCRTVEVANACYQLAEQRGAIVNVLQYAGRPARPRLRCACLFLRLPRSDESS